MLEFLNEMLINDYGLETSQKILEGYVNKVTSFRVNTQKTDISKVKQVLDNEKIEFCEVSWNKDALIVKNANEEDIRNLEIYINGEIYLQSLSSMIPPFIVNPKQNESILDMTAAPGGKTTQLFNLSSGKAMITACEKNKIRAERLKYNLEKQGANKVTVLIEDSRKLDDFFAFDKILLDAPCSGSGTIDTSNRDIEKSFSKELVFRSVKTQKELIRKAIKILKVNGELVYSTCSVLKEENERVINEILKQGNVKIVPIEIENFGDVPVLPVEIEGTVCVCPTKLYEGFFVAKLIKIK